MLSHFKNILYTVTFNNNIAGNGGIIYIAFGAFKENIKITFQGNSTVTFNNNYAIGNGGVMYIDALRVKLEEYFVDVIIDYPVIHIIIDGNSFVNFKNNSAYHNGGAICMSEYSHFTQLNNSTVKFYYNTANDYGGAIYAFFKKSFISFNGLKVHFKKILQE